MASEKLVINRTLQLVDCNSEILAHFYMVDNGVMGVASYGMFTMYQTNINDPRTFPGSPWQFPIPGFLDYLGRICAYSWPRCPWQLRSYPAGVITLLPELSADQLANVIGISVEVVREHHRNFLVYRVPLEKEINPNQRTLDDD
jgi:hypothetical protein